MRKGIDQESKSIKFETKKQVLLKIGLSTSTLYKMISEGKFPKPIHPHGTRTSLWVESEVGQWMTDRLAEAGREV